MSKSNFQTDKDFKLDTFHGYHFKIKKPISWTFFSTIQYQVIINGPAIGLERPNICVQIKINQKADIETLVNQISLQAQQNHINYQSNQPSFIQKGEVQIGQQLSNWLNHKTGKKVFQRFVYVKKETTFFIFSTTQPMHPNFDKYDSLFKKILNSINISPLKT